MIGDQRSRNILEVLRIRIFTRLMGGGPRTFPGGINKWQWKRLHEKRAREKEKRLLDQEKQLYQARIRTQIRASFAGEQQPDESNPEPNVSSHGPMSPKNHIKALADRFMKEGAEDLWNENDGPVRPPVPPSSNQRPRRPGFMGRNQWSRSINPPIDLNNVIREGNGHDFITRRGYSTHKGLEFSNRKTGGSGFVNKVRKFRRNESSSSEDDLDYDIESGSVKQFGSDLIDSTLENVISSRNVSDCSGNKASSVQKQRSFQRSKSCSSDDNDGDSEDEGVRRRKGVSEIGSRAALGKYDVKFRKRVTFEEIEKHIKFANELEHIRQELGKSKLVRNEGENADEGMALSQKRFDECGISPLTVKALAAAGYVQMTRVQEATLSVCLEGKDALVKAKTNPGKSAAFLLPAIEAVLKATNGKASPRASPIYVLILSPTRELASQIAAEAKALLKYHDGIGVQTLVGGTRFKDDQRRLETNPCQVLVATPGRLLDHIENKGGLSMCLTTLKMLIVDEADHLLDLGFRKDVEKIVDCLPRRRQSLLFSEKIPKEVRRISQLVLNREHAYVDTVGLGCVETPTKVKQSFLVVPQVLHFQVVHHLLTEHILQTPDFKVIVFCTTGMVASLLYQLLREMKMNVQEMHARKSQLHQTHISDEFKESKRQILVTADVSASGMNYPDVTLVIQVGVPPDRQQYVHRLARTGREGKDGEGILLISPWEEYFLDELKDLPLEKFPLTPIDPEIKLKVEDSIAKIDNSVKEGAYHAWLCYYNSIRETGRDKTTLVEEANKFCESIGLQKPPPLFRRTALQMGLKGIPGIRIRN